MNHDSAGAVGRYAFPDPYTLQEFQRAYANADAKGKIRLLRRVHADELVRLAVDDSDTEVRQWIARHGWLEKDLTERLRNDADPFVRACLCENPYYPPWRDRDWWKFRFAESTALDRLEERA